MNIIELGQDLDQMEEFEALPAGTYTAQLQDVEIRHSEKIPNGYLYIQLIVPTEEFPADYDVGNAPEGLVVTYANVKLPDMNNRRTVAPYKKLLEAVGVKAKGTKFDPNDWIGKDVQVNLTRSEYQGSPVNNVLGVGPVPSV